MSASSIEQGTPEWFALRLGKVTASRIVDVLARGKGGKPSASRANYCAELVTERLTGAPYPHFKSAAMMRGSEQEAACRAAYEIETGQVLEVVAFVPHPTITMAGASPDALVGDEGMYEAKNPHTATHISTLLGAPIDRDYVLQMQWQMACAGRKWVDFVSYDQRMPDHLALHIERVPRDAVMIAEVTREVTVFLAEVDELEQKLRRLRA